MSNVRCNVCGEFVNGAGLCPKGPHESSFAAPAGSGVPWVEFSFKRTEEFYIERDIFLRYVAFEVNPERLKAGLAVISDSVAARCFDIIANRSYRKPQNAPDQQQPKP